MSAIEKSVGVRRSTIKAVEDVFCRDRSREVETSKGVPVAHRYQSKQDFASDFLKDRHAIWMRWFESEIETRYVATGGGLDIIADVLQKGFEDQKRFRRAFISISTEDRTLNNEPFAIGKEQEEHLRRFVERLAVRMGYPHPDEAAGAAVLVIVRTILRAQMTGGPEEAQTARLLLQCLQHA